MSRRSGRSALAVAMVVFSALQGHADLLLDNFDGTFPGRWIFSNGAEFPGMTGSLALGPGLQGRGARLSFQNNGGGHYVAMDCPLATPTAAVGVSFDQRCAYRVGTTVRIMDATGQVLQFLTHRSMASTTDQAWENRMILFSSSTSHWGGANDGLVHQPVHEIDLVIDPLNNRVLHGYADFDNVTLLSDIPSILIDPAAPAAKTIDGRQALAGTGVCIHFVENNSVLNALQQAGFRWIRTDLRWASVEKTQGVYTFADYDALLDHLAQRQLSALLIFDYGNPLYMPANVSPATTNQVNAFTNYVSAAVAHFRGRTNVRYEVWNEPNIAFWKPTPSAAAYAALATATVKAARQADPQAVIAVGAIAGDDFPYVRAMLPGVASVHFDAVSIHPYRAEPETAVNSANYFRQLIGVQYPLDAPPLWSSEWGYSSAQDPADLSDGHGDVARRDQADLLSREYLCAWVVGFPMAIDYDAIDDGSDPTNREHNFGLLDQSGHDKPAMTAMRYLLGLAASHPPNALLPNPLNSLQVVRFGGASDTVLALWVDNSEQRSAIVVRFTSPPLDAHDDLGNPIARSPGSSTISVGAAPVFVRFATTSTSGASASGSALDHVRV